MYNATLRHAGRVESLVTASWGEALTLALAMAEEHPSTVVWTLTSRSGRRVVAIKNGKIYPL